MRTTCFSHFYPISGKIQFLAAKTALEATFLLVSQSKSVMLCNFRPSDLSVCLSVCLQVESDGRKL